MNLKFAACKKVVRTVASGVLIVLLGNGLVGGIPCAAQRAGDAQTTYDFQRRFQAGDVDRYKAEIVVTTSGPQTGGKEQSVQYTMVIRDSVKSLTPDGAMTRALEYEKAVATVEGKSLDMTARMPRTTEVRDRQGKVHLTIEGGNDPNAAVMQQMMATIEQAVKAGLPLRPVKVGETWNLNIAGLQDPSARSSGAARLELAESANGVKTLKVNYRTDTSVAGAMPAKVHADATLLIEDQTGKTIDLASRTDAWVGQTKTSVEIHYSHIDDTLYTVRRAYKPGEVDRYQINVVTTSTNPQAGGNDSVVKYALLVRETVKAVGPDGTTTLTDEYERATISFDNMEADITALMPTVTQVYNAQGGLDVKAEGGDARFTNPALQITLQIGMAQKYVSHPKPLKVSDYWTFTGDEGANVKTTGTAGLESTESVNGARALKLTCAIDTSGKSATGARTHSEATSFVDALTAKTLKLTSRSVSTVGQNKNAVDIAYSHIDDKAEAGAGGAK